MKKLNAILNNSASRPRVRVALQPDGIQVGSLVALHVVNNNFYEADTFEIRATLSGQPFPRNSEAWWLSNPEIALTVDAAKSPTGPWKTLIYGRVDDAVIDPVADEIILSGRDLTGLLIDSRISGDVMGQMQNLSASQIVTALMAPFSSWFSGNSITATSGGVGGYYAGNFLTLFRNRSVWDVITWLAQTNVDNSGNPAPFVAYVKGNSLTWGPQPEPTGYFLIDWKKKIGSPAANVISLDIAHNLTLAKDIAVTVMGFNPALGRYTSTASGKHNQGHTGGGSFSQSLYSSVGYQHFVYVMNGITPVQAQQLAQSKARELSKHEYILRSTLPGDLALDPGQLVRLEGLTFAGSTTNDFWPNAVTWRFSLGEGLEMELWCKNHPAAQQVIL